MNPVLQSLRREAAENPQRIVLWGSREALTASALLERVAMLAEALCAIGVSRAGLYCENGVDWIVADLACQCAGTCCVPVPTFFSDAQIGHIVEAAGLDFLLLERHSLPDNAPAPGGYPVMPGTRSLKGIPLFPAAAAALPPGTVKITFTSGSTGTPKGVCLGHEQCLNVARSLAGASELEAPRHLCVLPLSTLLENIGGVYAPLLCGGSVLIPAPHVLGLSGSSGLYARQFVDALDRFRPHSLILVPQLLAALDLALAQGWRAPDSLRFIAVGGARVSPTLLARVRAAGLPVYEGYGLSECASVVSLNSPSHDRPGSSGRLLPHLRARTEDGELLVAGNSFLGYLGEPESWGATEVRTGDIGRVDDDGFITVSGRRKHVLATSFGRNISPEWVESELLAGGFLREAVVLGDGRPFCSALVWAPAGVTEREIAAEIDRANLRLPDYARVRRWHRLSRPLGVENALLTANGRPRRGRIARHFADAVDALYQQPEECVAL